MQGGACVQQSTKAPAAATAPVAAGGAAANAAGVVLPCGIGLQQVAEEVEATRYVYGAHAVCMGPIEVLLLLYEVYFP